MSTHANKGGGYPPLNRSTWCFSDQGPLKELLEMKRIPKQKINVDFITDRNYKTVREDLALVTEVFQW